MSSLASTVPVRALRSSNFALVWVAAVVSSFGDPITLVALAYVSYRQTGSAFFTALAVVIATVPYALFSVFGGLFADALGHRRAMVLCDLSRVVLVGAVPLSLAAGLPLGIAFFLVFASATAASVFNPARLAIIPQLVASEDLPNANALVYSTDRAIEVVAAAAAGAFVATLGEAAFFIDAATFLVSAALLTRVRVREVRQPLHLRSFASDAGEGLRFLWRTTVLRANTVLSLVCQLAIPVVGSLSPVLFFQRFARGDAALGAAQFGAAEAAIALGAVVGTIVLPNRLARYGKGRLLLWGFAVYGAILIAIGFAPSFEIALLLFGLGGVANVVFYVPNVTISQELTPPALRARVFGARIALLNLSWLPVIVASGALADVFGAPVLIAVAGLLTLVAAAVGALFPVIRDVA